MENPGFENDPLNLPDINPAGHAEFYVFFY